MLRFLNRISCKGTAFLAWFNFLISGMLLASATVERFLFIAFPLKIKTWNMLGISKVLILVYVIVSSSLTSMWANTVDIVDYSGVKMCSGKASDLKVNHALNTVIYTVLGNGICASVILIFTILIACLLFSYKRNRSELSENSKAVQSQKEFRISLMLFIVACLFIVTRFPGIIIFEIRQYYLSKNTFQNNKVFSDIAVVYPISEFLTVINHSVNFVIYIVFLRKFREIFVQCFSCTFSGRAPQETEIQENLKSITVSSSL